MRSPRHSLMLAGLLSLGLAATASADAIYTVRDVGSIDRSQVEYFNLSGSNFLNVDAAGRVSVAPTWHEITPLPPGMRELPTSDSHLSPSGQFIVGTAFANASPGAAWAGYVIGYDGVARSVLPPDPSGSTFSTASGVNDAGWVVGSTGPVSGPAGSRAMVVSPLGNVTTLGGLGDRNNAAFSINASGAIVGEGQMADGFHAFVSNGRGVTDLNALVRTIPDFRIVSATGINDSGQIAAFGRFADEPTWLYHELLLSPSTMNIPELLPTPEEALPPGPAPSPQPGPVPEPTSLLAFLAVAACASRKLWRCRAARRGRAASL